MGRRQGGFTLAEVMLVLIVGGVLVGSGTLMFQQMRSAAAATTANNKVVALQGVVEKQISILGTVPSGQAVANAWVAARPDYANSPWGGQAVLAVPNPAGMGNPCYVGAQIVGNACSAANPTLPFAGMKDYLMDTVASPRCYPLGGGAAAASVPGESGVLYYFHINLTSAGGIEKHVDLWDNDLKLYYHANGYAVAITNNSGSQFYFVHGPMDFIQDPSQPSRKGMTRQPDNQVSCSTSIQGIVGSGTDPAAR